MGSLGLVHSTVGKGNLTGEWVEGRGHLPWSSFGIGNEVAGKADSGYSHYLGAPVTVVGSDWRGSRDI